MLSPVVAIGPVAVALVLTGAVWHGQLSLIGITAALWSTALERPAVSEARWVARLDARFEASELVWRRLEWRRRWRSYGIRRYGALRHSAFAFAAVISVALTLGAAKTADVVKRATVSPAQDLLSAWLALMLLFATGVRWAPYG
jgi:hypothetical protein